MGRASVIPFEVSGVLVVPSGGWGSVIVGPGGRSVPIRIVTVPLVIVAIPGIIVPIVVPAIRGVVPGSWIVPKARRWVVPGRNPVVILSLILVISSIVSIFVVRRGWRSSIIEAVIRVVTRRARGWIVGPASQPSASPSQVTSSPESTSEVCPPSRARPCGLAMVEIHPWCGPVRRICDTEVNPYLETVNFFAVHLLFCLFGRGDSFKIEKSKAT